MLYIYIFGALEIDIQVYSSMLVNSGPGTVHIWRFRDHFCRPCKSQCEPPRIRSSNILIYIYSPNKGFSLGRGSYLACIELPSYSRICHRQPRYLSPGTSAQVPSPAANSYYSRISHRQPRYLSPCTSAQVPKPRYLAQLPIAHIPGLLVVRVPRPGYLSLGT